MFEILIFFSMIAFVGGVSGLFLDILEKFGKKHFLAEGEYRPLFLNEEWYWDWFRLIPGILFAVGIWGAGVTAVLLYFM